MIPPWHAPRGIGLESPLWFCVEVWFGSAQTQGADVPSFGWEVGWGSGWFCSHLSALQGALFLKLSLVTSPKSEAGDLRDLQKLKPNFPAPGKSTRSSWCDFLGRKPCVVTEAGDSSKETVLELTQLSQVALQSSLGLFFLWSPTCKLG